MPIHHSHGITFVTSETLESHEVKHGFFMRHGGCSPQPWKSLNMATSVGDSRENVIENRNRIADALQINKTSFYNLWQVHSDRVVIADNPRLLSNAHIQADALVTSKNQVALLMLFADCVPILFYEPEHNVIASAHAGWKGTLSGVASETIKVMVEKFYCSPGNIIGVIGPSICRNHYQVGNDVVDKAMNVFRTEDNVINSHNEKIFMDLPTANRLIMEKCGMKTIERLDICTMCNNEDWFSHRGEKGKTGRFAAVITL
ncbi:MAG: peptidoglycan editing factor PgeF [Pelolinea sp.]|nr:peptidoglycan editing factor PgeF [Pelolinea sp.]